MVGGAQMTTKIRGSDVYVVEDLERILAALAGASRRYSGEYGAGYQDALRDLASAVGASIAMPCERIHEVIEYRHERTIERPAPAERRFAIRGEREEWPSRGESAAISRPAPVNMTGDDVNITLFNPAHGRLVSREIGHAWLGNDGATTYWNASEWQRVPTEEAQSWGELVPDDYGVLMRHAYANRKRAEAASQVRVLPRERGLLR